MVILDTRAFTVKLKTVKPTLQGRIVKVEAPSEVPANQAFTIKATGEVWATAETTATVWFELWETDASGRKKSRIGRSDKKTFKVFTPTAVEYEERLAMPEVDVLYLLIELYGEQK